MSGPVVSTEKDCFWSIPSGHRYNPYGEPESFTMGQLSELVVHAANLNAHPNAAVRYYLVSLGELLQAIGSLMDSAW